MRTTAAVLLLTVPLAVLPGSFSALKTSASLNERHDFVYVTAVRR